MKRRHNILILTHWSYADALIQAYTLPYIHIIRKNISRESKIFLVTFEQAHVSLSDEDKNKAVIFLRSNGIELITLNYSKFNAMIFFKAAIIISRFTWLIISQKIKTIHAWCTPAGSLGYVLSILTGRDLIIDSYEPHAESMVENLTWTKESLQFRILFYFEKKLSVRAKKIISATEGMKEYARSRYGLRNTDFYIKPACVDLGFFNPSKRKNPSLLSGLKLENKIVAVYAGKFGGIYLTKEVFAFFHQAEKFWGDRFRVLLLTNHPEEEILKWAGESNFDKNKLVRKFVPHSLTPEYIGLGDFGITPVKPIPTKRYCTPIKDGEYWAMGLPVVITKNISDDSEIIADSNAGAVIADLTDAGYKEAVERIDKVLNEKGHELRIRQIAEKYRSYRIAENVYREIYGE